MAAQSAPRFPGVAVCGYFAARCRTAEEGPSTPFERWNPVFSLGCRSANFLARMSNETQLKVDGFVVSFLAKYTVPIAEGISCSDVL
jgi:hypothetical protein